MNAATVAPIKTSRPRTCDELGVCQCFDYSTCQELSNSLLSHLSAPDAPGARGNVWFAEPEPNESAFTDIEMEGDHYPREPYNWVERLALVLLVGLSLASTLSVVAGVVWLFSLEWVFA